jgi:hypothetical protein
MAKTVAMVSGWQPRAVAVEVMASRFQSSKSEEVVLVMAVTMEDVALQAQGVEAQLRSARWGAAGVDLKNDQGLKAEAENPMTATTMTRVVCALSMTRRSSHRPVTTVGIHRKARWRWHQWEPAVRAKKMMVQARRTPK